MITRLDMFIEESKRKNLSLAFRTGMLNSSVAFVLPARPENPVILASSGSLARIGAHWRAPPLPARAHVRGRIIAGGAAQRRVKVAAYSGREERLIATKVSY
jgi:hypothetical protein